MLWIVLEALFQHVSVQEQWANLWWRSWNFPHGPGAWKVCKTKSSLLKKQVSMLKECTAGHEGAVADISCMSIFSACFGLPTSVQLAATTWSGQIWISGWILPHFDVRTISVAWKLKELQNIFWPQNFFLLDLPCKGLIHCALSRLSSSILSSKIDMWWNPTGTKPFLSFIKSPNIIIRNFQKTSQEIQNVLRWIGEEKSNKIKLKWFCIMYFCYLIKWLLLWFCTEEAA